jgi:MarR family transcriptional regulator for hemolysin
MGGVTLTGMPEPFPVPIGLRLNQVARAVGRAFDQALADAGGSLPVWLILLNLTIGRPGTQRELAEAVGIREATLSHHLSAMDADGLIARTRDAANRRVQVVTLTDKGSQAFLALRAAAVAFDARLRAGLDDADEATLATLLTRLSANVATPGEPRPPWAGLPGRDGAHLPRAPMTTALPVNFSYQVDFSPEVKKRRS